MNSNVPAYRIEPEIADAVADEAATLELARTREIDARTRAASLRAKRTGIEGDSTVDPAKRAKQIAELDAELALVAKDAELAERDAKRARLLLNSACERALRSPEAITRRNKIIADHLSGAAGERYATLFDTFRTDLLAMLSERSFVSKSIAAELREIPESNRSGNFDASVTPSNLPAHVDQAFGTVLDALTEFPFAHLVRQAIIGESGRDKLVDFPTDPAAFPPKVRNQIAVGLEARTAREWLRGDGD